MRDAIRGASCFLQGFAMLSRPGVRNFALAPLLASGVLFGAAFWLGAVYFRPVVDAAVARVPDWLQWLGALLWVLFAVFAAALLVLLFGVVAGAVSSPFNGPLAAAVEARLTGVAPAGEPWARALRRLPLTLLQELVKLGYGLAMTLGALLLFWIPGLNLVAPVVWVLCCGWLLALSYTDYAMANHGLDFAAMRGRLRRRWLLTLGFGGSAFLAMSIPLLNVLAVPAAVCGGAILWVRELAGGGTRRGG